jgi:PAS domain S-box-containing protein
MDNVFELRSQIEALQKSLEEKDRYIAKLERDLQQLQHSYRELEQKYRSTADTVETPAAITEFEETLKRLVHRIAMILQAEKCVFMLFDRETGELYAVRPAFGLTDEEIRSFRVRATQGISGEVFRASQPIIFHDAVNDPRTMQEHVALLRIRNGVSAPLIVEKRDEENRVIDRITIGVVHVFNKRYGGTFIEEDVRLLERLARNAAAVIVSAQMYREVVEEKEELVHTIESLYAGLVMVNKHERITQMNASARRIFGVKNGENVIGKPYKEVIHIEQVRELFENALTEKSEGAVEISVKDHETEAERVFQVQAAVVRGDEENDLIGAVAIFNDITEIRNVERMKTAFVSTVSHELRTPLTSIKGFVSTLLQDTEGFYDRETQREFLQIIDTETDRLKRLIDDLLNVSRIESGRALQLNPKPIDLPALAERVAIIQRSYTTKHQIILDFPEDFPTIVADEDKVDQILTNLINNAIKYSPRGGEVRVKGVAEGDTVLISVSDQGIGIPAEHLPKIFERFHRVDNRDTREAGGTGIGLFLVKHLVERHGGTIWVESEEGKGSTFYFRLPLQPPPEQPEDEKPSK